MDKQIDFDSIVNQTNRLTDRAYELNLMDVVDWDSIREGDYFSFEGNHPLKSDRLSEKQIETYSLKMDKLDDLMLPLASSICAMGDKNIKEFISKTEIGGYYVTKHLIQSNEIEKARELDLISKSAYKQYTLTRELMVMLSLGCNNLEDSIKIFMFIKANKMYLPKPGVQYAMNIVKSNLKSLLQQDKQTTLEGIDFDNEDELLSTSNDNYNTTGSLISELLKRCKKSSSSDDPASRSAGLGTNANSTTSASDNSSVDSDNLGADSDNVSTDSDE